MKVRSSTGRPRTTFKEIMDSDKLTGVIELNSQIRRIVISRNMNICYTSCDIVDTPCERGHECAAFKFLMKLVDTGRKPRGDVQ